MADAQSGDKLKLFISYSRRDLAATDALVAALESEGFEVTIDRRDLPYGEEWQKELADFIRGSDTVVWLVSPDSVASKWCNWELGEVARLSKRLVPVTLRAVAPEQLPEALGKIHLLPAEGVFDPAVHLAPLVAALNSDRGWIKQATRLADHAREWMDRGRDNGLLLRGPALSNAEAWSLRRPRAAPQLAAEVLELILASRRGAIKRHRWAVGGALAVAVMTSGLAFLAWQQRDVAIANEERAKRERDQVLTTQSRFLADLASQQAARHDIGSALLFALEGLPDPALGVIRPLVREPAMLLDETRRSLQEWKVISGHSLGVNDAAFSPDGRTIATASSDHTARLWDAANGQELKVFKGHTQAINTIVFSRDGRRFVTASNDRTVRVWDVGADAPIHILTGSSPRTVRSAAISPDGRRIVTTYSSEPAKLWDLEKPGEVGELRGHRRDSMPAFSPDSRRVVAPAEDNTARLWDSRTGGEGTVVARHDKPVLSAAFSPDGRRIVTASSDGTARLWNVGPGAAIKVFGSHQGDVTSATFSHDGRRIVTTSEDRTARVWDINAADDAPIQVFDNHDKTVLHASFDRDARRVLTIAADHVARLWDIESGQLLAVYSGHVEAMSRAVLSPDGRRILTAGADGTARLWNTDIAPPVGVPAGGVRGGLLLRPVFAPDRRHVVTEIWGQRARVLDIGADGKEIAAFPDHPGRIRYAAFSGDGRRVLTVSEGEGRLWEIGKERPLVVLAIPEGQMHAAAFRPDGLRVATAHSDGAVWLWDPSSPKPIALLGRHADEATGVVFSADGRHVLTTSTDTTARLWDVDGRKQAALFSGHRRAVLDAAFSADGKRVITASEDATAALWDAATGQRLALYSADDNALAKAAISPNGQRVMTLSTNNWMRLWDAEAGTEIMKVSSGKDWSFAFSVDGKSIIAASVEGIARTWQVSLTMQELIDGVKSALPRCLTPDQRKAAFLEPAPPVWCITGAGREREADPAKWEPKWPYRTPEWRQWLVDMRAGKTVPPPAGQ